MTRETFYSGKTLAVEEWWIHEPDLPERLTWGRRRVFADGTADACFEGSSTLYGFADPNSAAYILGEDEFVRFPPDAVDEDIATRDWSNVKPPQWSDSLFPTFEYLMTY